MAGRTDVAQEHEFAIVHCGSLLIDMCAQELQSSDTADAEQSTDPVASPSSMLAPTSQSTDGADTETVSGLGADQVNGTRPELLLSSPVSPPSGSLVKAVSCPHSLHPCCVQPLVMCVIC